VNPGAGSTRSRVDLDDAASYQALDPGGMLKYAVNFPDQLEQATCIGQAFRPDARLREPAQIVLAGMGGSAVGGDFLARLCQDHLPIPFLVIRDYSLPRFVGPDTLVVVSSYSGNAEETLAAGAAALERRARLVCITTGGELGEFAQAHGLPAIRIPQTDPPMRPRAAWGYSFIPLVFLVHSLGLYPEAPNQMREALGVVTELRDQLHPDVLIEQNPAKGLALALEEKIPWVHGTGGIMGAAAYRWRCQFNENSKVLAYSSEYPELDHNEVVGWELSPELARQIAVVILRRPGESWRTEVRLQFTHHLVGAKSPVHVIEARGVSPLAQLLWAVYYADFASIYLAFLHRADPASTSPIDELRRRLAQA